MSLCTLERQAADILRAVPAFRGAGVAVVEADAGDVFAEAGRALDESGGMAVVVDATAWRPRGSAARAPVGDAELTVTVIERPAAWRASGRPPLTGLSAAALCALALNLAPVDGGGGEASVLSLDPSGIESAFDADSGAAIRTLRLKTICILP